jgi:hypothetical protein
MLLTGLPAVFVPLANKCAVQNQPHHHLVCLGLRDYFALQRLTECRGFMQISKKVPFDDPNVLNGVRAMYILSNVIIACIYLYVQQQINKKNGTWPFTWKWTWRKSCSPDPLQT